MNKVDEIKQALEKIETADWKAGTLADGYPFMQIMGEDCVTVAENAPTWLKWQNEQIERLEKALEDIGDEMTDDTSKRAQRINKIIMEALEGRNLYERSGQ